jgi:hypothetical protein
MIQRDQLKREVTGSFYRPLPTDGERSYFDGEGKRKSVSTTAARPLRWPEDRASQRVVFDAWHAVAMQVVHHHRGSFRTLAIFHKFINWMSGTLWPSDETMASHAGRCTTKTVSRDLGAYRDMGLISICSRYINKQKVRVLRLTIPSPLPDGIVLPEDIEQMDTGGPFGRKHQKDTGGPNQMDTGGPYTSEETYEGRLL